MSLAPGSRLGPYEIVSPLGAGGMGEVYRARDSRLKRDVAIKVLPADVAGNPERLGRFQRESHLLASLNHANIASIYGVEEQGGTTALVMELVEGESLADKIARGPLALDDAIAIARSVADALEYAHERGIIHRDLKPANIVVSREGLVKVLDFGLAKAITGDLAESSGSDATHSPTLTSPATRAGVILGTAAYMAPEQARGKAVDRRADIWAFGVVLYEMLTGRRMFEGETVSDTIAAILTRSPDYTALPSNTPASVRRLLERCLDRDPKQRLRDIGEARILLAAAQSADEPAATTAAGPLAARARRPALPWVVAGLAVAGAAAWVFTMSSHRGSLPQSINYTQKTYASQTILQALYAPDGQTIVYSAATGGSTPYLYALRAEYTDPLKVSPDPLQLLSISSHGELAVLTDPHWIAHRLCVGTLARMPLSGGAPRDIMEHVAQATWAPDGNDLAISHEVGGVWRLEYPAGTVLYQTGAYISDLRFSPDGKHIAYFEHPFRFDDRGGVAVVDLKGKRTLLADGYWGEEGIAWSADASTVYYSAGTGYSDFSIYAVTLDGKVRVAAQSAGGLVIHDIASTGEWLATRDDLTRVMLSGVAGGSERDISWQDLSIPADISSDGRMVLFTESGTSAGNNYQVCTRGTDGSAVVVLGEGAAIDLSDDGRWALAGIAPNRILAYPTGAGKTIELDTHAFANVTDARWVSDKQVLILAGAQGQAQRAYLLDVAGGAPRPITPMGTLGAVPSPDGTRILVTDSDMNFVIMGMDSSSARTVARGIDARADNVAGWSADGKSLYVFPANKVPSSIDMVDPATGTRRSIIPLVPRVSPVLYISTAVTTPDHSAYVYDAVTYLSRLYTMKGAR